MNYEHFVRDSVPPMTLQNMRKNVVCMVIQSQGGAGCALHAGPTLPVRVQVGWRVLAGFWRKKAGAGRVPSFISGCAAAKMLKGVFSRIVRMA
jgi:hypothetical protein